MASVVVPDLRDKKQTTRYRDGKVVTTTGAKVIVTTCARCGEIRYLCVGATVPGYRFNRCTSR